MLFLRAYAHSQDPSFCFSRQAPTVLVCYFCAHTHTVKTPPSVSLVRHPLFSCVIFARIRTQSRPLLLFLSSGVSVARLSRSYYLRRSSLFVPFAGSWNYSVLLFKHAGIYNYDVLNTHPLFSYVIFARIRTQCTRPSIIINPRARMRSEGLL